MNDYKTPGNYYCRYNGIAATLKNSPYTQSFVLKVDFAQGAENPRQTFINYYSQQKAVRVYSGSSWSNYVYFSDDSTLFTSQSVAITDGDYGHVNGSFKRIGSILIFSFYIALTKKYSANNDALFTFNTIKSSARYDFPAYTSSATSIQVYDLLIRNSSDTPSFNMGNDISIPAGTTIFCSGTMLVTDK